MHSRWVREVKKEKKEPWSTKRISQRTHKREISGSMPGLDTVWSLSKAIEKEIKLIINWHHKKNIFRLVFNVI